MIFPIDEIAKLNLSILSSFVSKRFSFASFHFYLQFWSELKKAALWFLNGVVHKLLIESVYNSRAENFYEIRRWLFLFPFKKKNFSLHFVCSSEWNWVIRKERNILENHNHFWPVGAKRECENFHSAKISVPSTLPTFSFYMATRDYRKLRWQSEHETWCQTLKIDKNFSPNLHIPATEKKKKKNNKIK